MTRISTINHEWSTRKPEERFLTLPDMLAAQTQHEGACTSEVYSVHDITLREHGNRLVLDVPVRRGTDATLDFQRHAAVPNHWALQQLCQRTNAPAEYLRRMPARIVADCLNEGLRQRRADALKIQVKHSLATDGTGTASALAVNGPQFEGGSDAAVVRLLIERFGNGQDGDFRIPGEFGVAVPVTSKNTTLYYGERGMTVYLADEKNRITIPNRRAGKFGDFARGFILQNSSVGDANFTIQTFLFDYTCRNRNIWGVANHNQIRIRHTGNAPERIINEAYPALYALSNESTKPMQDMLITAMNRPVSREHVMQMYGERTANELLVTHMREEQRPIESMFDLSAALSAKAKGSKFIDQRISLERQAGAVLELAS